MIISQLFIYFIIFSFLGWIYECIYCSITEKGWRNRGFLYGPICPIYGSGVAAIILLFGNGPLLGFELVMPYWQIFLLCMAGSAVLEYGTSWILEKLFHAVWWDYSDMPLNLNGRICLPASLGFGTAGILIVKFVLPFVESLPADNHPLATEVTALLMMMVFGMDLALTVNSLIRIQARMDSMEKEFNIRMESGYQRIVSAPEAVSAAATGMVKRASESVENAVRTVQDGAESVASLAAESGESVKQKVTDQAEEYRKRVSETGEEVTSRLKSAVTELTHIDLYHIRTIREYRPEKKKSVTVTERLKKAFGEMKVKADDAGVYYGRNKKVEDPKDDNTSGV